MPERSISIFCKVHEKTIHLLKTILSHVKSTAFTEFNALIDSHNSIKSYHLAKLFSCYNLYKYTEVPQTLQLYQGMFQPRFIYLLNTPAITSERWQSNAMTLLFLSSLGILTAAIHLQTFTGLISEVPKAILFWSFLEKTNYSGTS